MTARGTPKSVEKVRLGALMGILFARQTGELNIFGGGFLPFAKPCSEVSSERSLRKNWWCKDVNLNA